MKLKSLLTSLTLLLLPLTFFAQEVYVPNSRGGIDPLTRAVIMGTKTGNGLFALYGKKITSSLVLDGKSSNNILPKTSTIFYVMTPNSIPIQAWKLAALKSKKNNRELPFMKTGAYTGSSTDIDEIQMMVTKIADDVYELRPLGDLKNGDYALMYIENGVPVQVYDFRIESNLPPYPYVSHDTVLAEFLPSSYDSSKPSSTLSSDTSNPIIRWFFDSDPRGARIFYRVISSVPNEVKNTNESYMTTTPLEETKALNIPGLTYQNAPDVVIEIKVTKRGYEEQTKRYNVRQVLDQQEISGFFELVEK